jgi:8-oxo-dGTP diphosphatase
MIELQKEFVQLSHCSFRGTRFTEQDKWPRKCFHCYNDSYKNPIPVVVALIEVTITSPLTHHETGFLIQQRNIEPKKGEWALPSGYMNFGETWQEAVVRENKEEMNLDSNPDDYELYSVRNSSAGNLLIFSIYRRLIYDIDILDKFLPNEEVQDIGFHFSDTGLAFPTHNECIKELLERKILR